MDMAFQLIKSALADLLASHHVHVSAASLTITVREGSADNVGDYLVQILRPLRGSAVLLWTETGLRVELLDFTVNMAHLQYGASGNGSGHALPDLEMEDPTLRMGTPVALERGRPTPPLESTGLSWRELAAAGHVPAWNWPPAPATQPPHEPPPVATPTTPEPSPREQRTLRL